MAHPTLRASHNFCAFTTQRFVKSAKIQIAVSETAKTESDKQPGLCRVLRSGRWVLKTRGELGSSRATEDGIRKKHRDGMGQESRQRHRLRALHSHQLRQVWCQDLGTAAPGPMGALGMLQLTRDVQRKKEQSLPCTSVKSRMVNFS